MSADFFDHLVREVIPAVKHSQDDALVSSTGLRFCFIKEIVCNNCDNPSSAKYSHWAALGSYLLRSGVYC